MSGSPGRQCQTIDSDQNDVIDQKLSAGTPLCGKEYSTQKLLKSILSNYVQFVQSPGRQDSVLKTVQYSLWLLSKFYHGSRQNRRLPNRVVESLLTLQGEISWARYLLRFFGFPAAINDLDLQSGWSTGNNSHRIGRVMSWTMVFYYPLENLAYLLWKAPGIRWLPIISTTPIQNPESTTCPKPGKSENFITRRYSSAQLASKASAWSCRFWLTWIVLDIVRCALSLREIQQADASKTMTPTSSTHKGSRQTCTQEESVETSQRKDSLLNTIITVRTEHMRILRNLLYVLPAITWSLPSWDTDPLLSGDVANGLCWLESMVGLYQGVNDYQKS